MAVVSVILARRTYPSACEAPIAGLFFAYFSAVRWCSTLELDFGLKLSLLLKRYTAVGVEGGG